MRDDGQEASMDRSKSSLKEAREPKTDPESSGVDYNDEGTTKIFVPEDLKQCKATGSEEPGKKEPSAASSEEVDASEPSELNSKESEEKESSEMTSKEPEEKEAGKASSEENEEKEAGKDKKYPGEFGDVSTGVFAQDVSQMVNLAFDAIRVDDTEKSKLPESESGSKSEKDNVEVVKLSDSEKDKAEPNDDKTSKPGGASKTSSEKSKGAESSSNTGRLVFVFFLIALAAALGAAYALDFLK
jgi:hypothetical protein